MTGFILKSEVSQMRELQAIQKDIDQDDYAIQNAGAGVDTSAWEAEKARYEREFAEATAYWENEANQRISLQAQAQQIGGLKETISNIFEASFPKDETVKLMGLTEYESTQQTFNQLIDQAVDEDQLALYAIFQQQLEDRDEKVRTLTINSLETQKSLEVEIEISRKLEIQNDKMAVSIDNKDEEISAFMNQILEIDEKYLRESQAASIEIDRLNGHIFDLQKQIANLQLPTQSMDFIPTIASESLTERIAKAKANSKLQLANVRNIGANWVEGINSEGNKEIAHVSEVEAVEQFLPLGEYEVEPVEELVEDAEPGPKGDIESETADSQGDSADLRDTVTDEVVEQHNEEGKIDIKAEQIEFLQNFVNDLNTRHIELSARVYNLETKQAVA